MVEGQAREGVDHRDRRRRGAGRDVELGVRDAQLVGDRDGDRGGVGGPADAGGAIGAAELVVRTAVVGEEDPALGEGRRAGGRRGDDLEGVGERPSAVVGQHVEPELAAVPQGDRVVAGRHRTTGGGTILEQHRLELVGLPDLLVAEDHVEQLDGVLEAFDAAGLRPQDLGGLDDLNRFPFTAKTALRDNYPFGLLAVPLAAIAGVLGRYAVKRYLDSPLYGGDPDDVSMELEAQEPGAAKSE